MWGCEEPTLLAPVTSVPVSGSVSCRTHRGHQCSGARTLDSTSSRDLPFWVSVQHLHVEALLQGVGETHPNSIQVGGTCKHRGCVKAYSWLPTATECITLVGGEDLFVALSEQQSCPADGQLGSHGLQFLNRLPLSRRSVI